MREDWDVAVVGGGFAGSLAAYTLAREGLRTAVFERGKQIGLETRSGNLALGSMWRKTGLKLPRFFLPVRKRQLGWLEEDFLFKVLRPASNRQGELFFFRRKELDGLLRERLTESGVALFDDFCVEGVWGSREGPAYVYTGSRTVSAKAVLVATGTDEQVLARSGLLCRNRSSNLLFLAQQQLELPSCPKRADGEASLFELVNLPGFRNAKATLVFPGNEAVITAMGVLPSQEARRFDPRLLMRTIKNSPVLEAFFSGQRVREWRIRFAGPFPPARRRLHKDRVLVIGDAAYPLGGPYVPGGGFNWAAFTALTASRVLLANIEKPTRLNLRRYPEKVIPARWARTLSCHRFMWKVLTPYGCRLVKRLLTS